MLLHEFIECRSEWVGQPNSIHKEQCDWKCWYLAMPCDILGSKWCRKAGIKPCTGMSQPMQELHLWGEKDKKISIAFVEKMVENRDWKKSHQSLEEIANHVISITRGIFSRKMPIDTKTCWFKVLRIETHQAVLQSFHLIQLPVTISKICESWVDVENNEISISKILPLAADLFKLRFSWCTLYQVYLTVFAFYTQHSYV